MDVLLVGFRVTLSGCSPLHLRKKQWRDTPDFRAGGEATTPVEGGHFVVVCQSENKWSAHKQKCSMICITPCEFRHV